MEKKKKKASNGLNHPWKEARASVRTASLHAKHAQRDAASPEGKQSGDNILREYWACNASSSFTELDINLM